MNRSANPLAKAGNPARRNATERIKATIHRRLALADDVAVSISELSCHDGGCPDVETVIAILASDTPPIVARIPARIVGVTDADLEAAVRTLAFGRGAMQSPS
jgi:hypothetical protein